MRAQEWKLKKRDVLLGSSWQVLAWLCLVMGFGQTAMAQTRMIDFEDLQNYEKILSHYDGGYSSKGFDPGPDYNIDFGESALSLVDSDVGGSGNFGGEPSGETVLFWVSGSAVMNVMDGFSNGFSFYYASPMYEGTVTIYDGPDATGQVLATMVLPLTPFNGAPDPTGTHSPFLPYGVAFEGVARSVDFSGTANQIAFDNLTLGSAIPLEVGEEENEETDICAACDENAYCENVAGTMTCVCDYAYQGDGTFCEPACGNGALDTDEECDDGGLAALDGCDEFCQLEYGFVCQDLPSVCASVCGDSMLAADEQCDDGNELADDGCGPDCLLEYGYSCSGEPSVCVSISKYDPDAECRAKRGFTRRGQSSAREKHRGQANARSLPVRVP